jgi:hypothetical protein
MSADIILGITYRNGARDSSDAVTIWHILSVSLDLIWSAEAAKMDPLNSGRAHTKVSKEQPSICVVDHSASTGLAVIGYTIALKA